MLTYWRNQEDKSLSWQDDETKVRKDAPFKDSYIIKQSDVGNSWKDNPTLI